MKAILADSKLQETWAVRGLTRDASKESSKKLAAQGVDMVEVGLTAYLRLAH